MNIYTAVLYAWFWNVSAPHCVAQRLQLEQQCPIILRYYVEEAKKNLINGNMGKEVQNLELNAVYRRHHRHPLCPHLPHAGISEAVHSNICVADARTRG